MKLKKLKIFLFIILFSNINLSFASNQIMSNLSKQGPKMRVAVAKFGATDKFASVYGGWNIGGGLAAQLVTELIQTQRVVVVERAILSKVLMEQELGEANLLTPMTKNPVGHLLGVDYLIVGEVTEFENRQMGSGMAAKIFGLKIGGEINAATVGMDLRIVDTRTGEILYSHYSRGRAWEKAGGVKFDYKIIDFGGDTFHKTPLGRATRHAIDDAINFILGVIDKHTEELKWLGRVIEVEGNTLYINAGSNSGITTGDIFNITKVRKILTDPATNQLLGLLEKNIGQAKAIYVDKKYTRAIIIDKAPANIGDIIRFANNKKQNFVEYSESPVGYNMLD